MKVVVVDGAQPEREQLEEAARVLRNGGLVAFPTETVYGLGASAMSDEAVEKIFTAKGRPATNPLIVHVANIEAARRLAGEWSQEAEALAQAFWPGPLTLVVRRKITGRGGGLSEKVSAGLDTVAIRVPAHPVAKALIELAACPIAAPSANRYTRVSPTRAQHVVEGLGGRVDIVVDGGPTNVGLESTLVSLVEETPRVLRRGMISVEDLGQVVAVEDEADRMVEEATARSSPGLSRKHYSPGAALRVVDSAEFRRLLAEKSANRGFIGRGEGRSEKRVVWLPEDPQGYARELYGALHTLDSSNMREIVVERPPAEGEWAAILDRLGRASAE